MFLHWQSHPTAIASGVPNDAAAPVNSIIADFCGDKMRKAKQDV
jgi:hypothetical protein